MKRFVWLLVLSPLANVGCVERSYIINSDAPGALVYRNGEPIGSTPVSENFVHYGTYQFTLVRDGYEPLEVRQEIPRPWYQIPFVDFVFEHLIPYKFQDRHEFTYILEPKRQVRTDELLQRAYDRRIFGRSIGETAAPDGATAPPLFAPPSQ